MNSRCVSREKRWWMASSPLANKRVATENELIKSIVEERKEGRKEGRNEGRKAGGGRRE